MTHKNTGEILARVEQTLVAARAGYDDAVGKNPKRRVPGLWNLVVFGRAVTNVLQNLRSTEREFDEWYRPREAEMRADPLLKYLYDRRSEILKEGAARTGVSVLIKEFSFPADMAKFGPAPPNARGFVIGDPIGGTGWEVELPDGNIEKYYVELPDEIGEVELLLADAPTQHLGVELPDRRLQTICAAYLTYLERLVRAAKERFGPKGA